MIIAAAMEGFSHTGRAAYPTTRRWIELVAYERTDGGWDAFAFQPPGILPPEWESSRVDANHVFLGTLRTSSELDLVGEQIDRAVGPDYEPVFAFRETVPDDDRRCRRALHLLHKKGCTGYDLKCGTDRIHELWVRRRDLPIIAKVK